MGTRLSTPVWVWAMVMGCLCGCGSYRVPGGPADFRVLGVSSEIVEENTEPWTRDAVVDAARRETEPDAFDKLVDELAATWPLVLETYGPGCG